MVTMRKYQKEILETNKQKSHSNRKEKFFSEISLCRLHKAEDGITNLEDRSKLISQTEIQREKKNAKKKK